MMKDGLIKVGTLYDFRIQEDMERGDKNEGKKHSVTPIDETLTITNANDLPGNFKQLVNHTGGTLILNKGSSGILNQGVKDSYVYCCSTKFEKALLQSFEAEVCIEIFDSVAFAREIMKQMSALEYSYGATIGGDCSYIGHEVLDSVTDSAHFLKDKEYKHQHEYRYLFPPLVRKDGKIIPPIISLENGKHKIDVPNVGDINNDIIPVVIECKEAIQFCRVIS